MRHSEKTVFYLAGVGGGEPEEQVIQGSVTVEIRLQEKVNRRDEGLVHATG